MSQITGISFGGRSFATGKCGSGPNGKPDQAGRVCEDGWGLSRGWLPPRDKRGLIRGHEGEEELGLAGCRCSLGYDRKLAEMIR